jgi:hypothetical protein
MCSVDDFMQMAVSKPEVKSRQNVVHGSQAHNVRSARCQYDLSARPLFNFSPERRSTTRHPITKRRFIGQPPFFVFLDTEFDGKNELTVGTRTKDARRVSVR